MLSQPPELEKVNASGRMVDLLKPNINMAACMLTKVQTCPSSSSWDTKQTMGIVPALRRVYKMLVPSLPF